MIQTSWLYCRYGLERRQTSTSRGLPFDSFFTMTNYPHYHVQSPKHTTFLQTRFECSTGMARTARLRKKNHLNFFTPTESQRIHIYILNQKKQMCISKTFSHQILDPIVIKVSAALREPVQQDFDKTLVPRWTHCEETVLQDTTTLINMSG